MAPLEPTTVGTVYVVKLKGKVIRFFKVDMPRFGYMLKCDEGGNTPMDSDAIDSQTVRDVAYARWKPWNEEETARQLDNDAGTFRYNTYHAKKVIEEQKPELENARKWAA